MVSNERTKEWNKVSDFMEQSTETGTKIQKSKNSRQQWEQSGNKEM